MDLNTRLSEIREMQGLDPLPNPGVIQGFESGAPPPPAWSPPTSTQDGEEDDEPDYPDSPLIDMAVKRVAPERKTARETLGIPAAAQAEIDLIVVDTEAAYKGHTVSLNPTEKSAIARVILAASQRILDEHLRETEIVVPVASLEAPGPILKRKRGRPKKA